MSKGWLVGLALSVLAVQAQAQPHPELDVPKVVPLPGPRPAPQPGAPPQSGDPPPPMAGFETAPQAQAGGGCAPPKLFRTTVRNITPGLQAADRRAQPRQIWRQGSLYLRSVEQPIPPGGDQQIAIVSEPDIWMINTATSSGQHARDPGPVFEVRMPILPVAPDLPPTFRSLEYGCEPDFVTLHAPAVERTLSWGGARATLHTVTEGQHSLALLMDDRRKEPLMISYLRQGRPVFVVRYDDYQHGLPDRPQLFQPPAQFKIVEAPAQQPRSAPPTLEPAPGSRPF